MLKETMVSVSATKRVDMADCALTEDSCVMMPFWSERLVKGRLRLGHDDLQRSNHCNHHRVRMLGNMLGFENAVLIHFMGIWLQNLD